MPLCPRSWLLSVVTALALQNRTVGWWILAVPLWNAALSFLSRKGEEVGHSGWNVSWEQRWNHLGVRGSRWSTSWVHRQRASRGSRSTGMLKSEWKRHLDLLLMEVGVWISYKVIGGAVDTETAGRCCGLLLVSALRRALALPCSLSVRYVSGLGLRAKKTACSA